MNELKEFCFLTKPKEHKKNKKISFTLQSKVRFVITSCLMEQLLLFYFFSYPCFSSLCVCVSVCV